MPRKKKPVTTKKGQHHKFKSFMMNLVKDNDISKVDTNVLRKHKESFEKKKVTFEKRNSDPAHFHDAIYREFPSVNGMEFSLWRLPKNNSTLIPFPKNINNAVALCRYEDLNRSVIYIRLMAASNEMQEEGPESSHFYEPDMNQVKTSDDSDDDEEPEEQMEVSMSREQTMPQDIAKKRKHLSESEDQQLKRRSNSTCMRHKGIPSSSGDVLEEIDHEVASSLTSNLFETLFACIDAGSENNLNPRDTLIAQMTSVPVLDPVMDSQPAILDHFVDVASNANNVAPLPIEWIENAQQKQFLNTQTAPASYLNSHITGSVNRPDLQNQFTTAAAFDVNVSSVRIDAGREKSLNPQDTLIAQMTPVHARPFLNPVMNYRPSILNQFAEVANSTLPAASLPNECFHNVHQEPFRLQHPLNAQSTRPFSNFLPSDSIYQPNLQNQLISSNQIQSFNSSGFNENYRLKNRDLLQQQVNDSGQFPADIAQSNQFSNLQNVYNLSIAGRHHSNTASTPDEAQNEVYVSSNFCEPDTNQDATSDDDEETEEEMDASVSKAELIGKFDCNLRSIIGLAALNKRLYIISGNSELVAIHSSHNPFEKISDQEVKGMKAPFQIFASSKNSCLYIVDANKSVSKCIWKATDNNEFVANRLIEDVNCCCLSVTKEGDLVLLDDKNYCLHLYNSDSGRCFRCIHLSKIDRMEFGDPYFVISSLDNAFYISSTGAKTHKSMVYKISCDGELLNTFGGRSGKGSGQLGAYRHCPLILDRYGRVIVLDDGNDRVLLLNSNLEYIATLLSVSMYSNLKICCDDDDTLFTNETYQHGRAYNIAQFEPDNLMKITTQKPLKYDEVLNKAHMLGNISESDIRGVSVLLDKIYLLTSSSICIHSCVNPFQRIHLENFYGGDFWDIAADDKSDNRRLYVTDKAKHCIWKMDIDLRKKKWLQNIRSPYSLSVSKDGSVVIPNNRELSIDIYKGGKTAQLLLSLKLYSGLNYRVKLRHAIKVQEHYVICYVCTKEDFEDVNDDFVTDQVLLVSTNGDILSSFEGLSSSNKLKYLSTSNKLNLPNHLAVDREGGMIVADSKNKRVIRLNGKLEHEKILLSDETEGIDKPQRLSYDRKNDRLLVCYSQSLDIFSFSLEIQKQSIDPKLSTGIKSPDLCQDVFSFEFPKFQKISQVDSQTMKYKEDERCLGVAILREQLYLLISDSRPFSDNAFVCVHQSDPPFDLISKVQNWGQTDFSFCHRTCIVASSAHDRCYINNESKIYSIITGSQKAEEFLESEEEIRSMSVTAEGQLLVVYDEGKLATYNYYGECTECIFSNDIENWFDYGVKTGEGKFICIALDDGRECLKSIYERSVDGSNCCFYGPFDTSPFPFECKATTLGEDGQVFILLDNGKVLSYDYKRHLLSVQLAEDDHKMSDVTGFCYSREKKQLLVCGHEGIAILQMLQNKQSEQSSEKLESMQREKNSSNDEEIDKSSEDKKRRLLYSVGVSASEFSDFDRARGITRLGNNTYILWSSELLVIDSKDIQMNNFIDPHHSLTIPEPPLDLIEGGLMDIAASRVGLCLYVTDKNNRCVWSVTIDHKINRWLDDIDSPYTLSVTEDGSVCILDNSYRQLDVYNSDAVRRKSIRLPRFMTHLRHAVQTSSGNFVICCNTKNVDENDDDDREGDEEKDKTIKESSSKSQDASECLLCEISPEGALIRRFTSTESAPSSQLLVEPLHLAIDANDRIFVFDGQQNNRRILLFDNQLNCIENIVNENSFKNASPRHLFYDSSRKELLVICFDIAYGGRLLMCLEI